MNREATTPENPTAEPAAVAETAPPPGGLLLRGTSVAPGLVLGHVHRKDYDLSRAHAQRVPLDAIDRELGRFRQALDDSRLQLQDLKSRLEGRVKPDDARILDTHLAYLKDSVFIADVENLILNEQLGLEAAIAKVISDFDRIFRLVENATLRQSAIDLRDVAIRVLRNLEQASAGETAVAAEDGVVRGPLPAGQYVLAARELSIVDMFNLSNEHVQGIVTEEGGLTSHAAVFARSMRIPTVTAVEGLLDRVYEGDFVILDATEGIVRVNPSELVRQQYLQADREPEPEPEEREVPDWARFPARTHDGTEIEVQVVCGNLPEVEQAAALGLPGVGLYRTELLYLIDRDPPSREALIRHYSSVVEQAAGGPVTFRLLNVDSGLEIPYLHEARELNPQLGRAGVRLLLSRESILRRQIQAILMASPEVPVRIAVPFVCDCGELRRVKEILFEEKLELRRAGLEFQDRVELGCVLETPASLLGMRDLAREAEFLVLGLDSLTQYLLAADRESSGLAPFFETMHPFVLRALTKACEIATGLGRELTVFGVTAAEERNLPLLLGAGLRNFCLPPSGLRGFLTAVAGLELRAAGRAARAAARSSSPSELHGHVSGYRHGYAR